MSFWTGIYVVKFKERSPQEIDFFDFEDNLEQDNEDCVASLQNRTNDIELEILQYLKDRNIELESLNKYPMIKKLFMKYNTCRTPGRIEPRECRLVGV